MSDTDARAAKNICEAIENVLNDVEADEATIATAIVLALGRRIARQVETWSAADAALGIVAANLGAVVDLHMRHKLGPG